MENGDENEEAKFAAVERPRSSSPDEIKAGKYVAPGRRKQHNTQAGKLIRPTQLINSNISGSPSTSSVQVVPHQNSNNKYSALVSHSLPLQQSVQKTSGKMYFWNSNWLTSLEHKCIWQRHPLQSRRKHLCIECTISSPYNRFGYISII